MNKLVLISLILMASMVSCEVTYDEGVAVLTDENFAGFIAEYENVLVEFYAPWCGHCKKLAPEYSAAAEAVKDQANLRIAKVDATEAKELANTYAIKGFPTLKFFKKGNPTDYSGGRTKDAIVDYCLKKSGPSVHPITSKENLDELRQKYQVVVTFFGSQDSDAFKVFSEVADSYDDVVFGQSSAEVGALENAVENSVVLFKQFDEKRNDLAAGFAADGLRQFVDSNGVPNVLPFNDKCIELTFHKQTPTLFLFNDDAKDTAAAADLAFSQGAQQNKGKGVIFAVSKPSDGSGNYQKLGDYVGADINNAPVIMLVHSSGELNKFKFTSEISADNISAFVNDYTAGKLQKYMKSADAPATNDEAVKVVVGTTFNDIVINNDKDVLVEFYAPWCGHCKTLEPLYLAAAKEISYNTNVVLAKCDATANEVPGVAIQGFPTLKFWPGNAKNSPPVDFEGNRDKDDIINFMKSKATKAWPESEDSKTDL